MQALIDDLIETMRAADGAGLAANQIDDAVADRGRRGRAGEPALPVQAGDPADGASSTR